MHQYNLPSVFASHPNIISHPKDGSELAEGYNEVLGEERECRLSFNYRLVVHYLMIFNQSNSEQVGITLVISEINKFILSSLKNILFIYLKNQNL